MTLIGIINSRDKTLLFGDRLWKSNQEDVERSKIFVNKNQEDYLAVSGLVLSSLVEDFITEDLTKKERGIKKMIYSSYGKCNAPGTSFIHYNSEKRIAQGYFLDNSLIQIPIINYLFLGIDVKNLKDFDFRDEEHTLMHCLLEHKKKHSSLIGNKFDLITFKNKVPVWNVICT